MIRRGHPTQPLIEEKTTPDCSIESFTLSPCRIIKISLGNDPSR
jgi:hypothetical protein